MVWYCEDFSEEEGTHEKLSARFSSSEVANKFKEVFENAVKSAEKGERIYHDNAGVEKQLFSNNSLLWFVESEFGSAMTRGRRVGHLLWAAVWLPMCYIPV